MPSKSISAWMFRAFFVLGVFVCLQPGNALGADIIQPGIATFNATEDLTQYSPCNSGYTDPEIYIAKREEFLAGIVDGDEIWCGQVFDFEENSGVTILSDHVTQGSLSWKYDNVRGAYGSIVAELSSEPAAYNRIYLDRDKYNKFPMWSFCPHCTTSCADGEQCFSFLYILTASSTVTDSITITFSEPVGAAAISFSALKETGETHVKLYHNDDTVSWILINNQLGDSEWDATFFGAKINDSDLAMDKAIKKIALYDPSGADKYIGIDDIFIATIEQSLTTPTEYGYPVAVISNMSDPEMVCSSGSVDLGVDGRESYVAGKDDEAENDIATYYWVLEDKDDPQNVEEAYTAVHTFPSVAPGLYDLSLTVTDEYDDGYDTDSAAVRLAVGDCPVQGETTTRVVVIPLGCPQ